jgi:hypothetical protein
LNPKKPKDEGVKPIGKRSQPSSSLGRLEEEVKGPQKAARAKKETTTVKLNFT